MNWDVGATDPTYLELCSVFTPGFLLILNNIPDWLLGDPGLITAQERDWRVDVKTNLDAAKENIYLEGVDSLVSPSYFRPNWSHSGQNFDNQILFLSTFNQVGG